MNDVYRRTIKESKNILLNMKDCFETITPEERGIRTVFSNQFKELVDMDLLEEILFDNGFELTYDKEEQIFFVKKTNNN